MAVGSMAVLLDRFVSPPPETVAVLATLGLPKAPVYRRPRVAILSTGDEIRNVRESPLEHQMRDSNASSLAAQVRRAGGSPFLLPAVRDDMADLAEVVGRGLKSDLLLISGGVSAGKYDLVEQVLAELQAEFYFTGAEIQPGRPVVFGSCGWDTSVGAGGEGAAGTRAGAPAPHKKYFFGLPGNPVSTMVTFELFVRPMVEALAGQTPQRLIFLRARLKSEIRTKTGLKRFLPAVLSGEFENAEVELARWQGSGDIAALARANCYVVIPPERERIEAGEWVPLLMR